MSRKTTKVRICPFCGHHGQELIREYRGDNTCGTDVWHIHCKCCHADGPEELEADYAIDSWNHIYKRPAHSDDPMEVEFPYEDCLLMTTDNEGNTL